ncbi:LPS export ABC transporter permease LptF [Umboniibacter marinipuniceus]|uniref:Lipopolysaccharide export system permease protein LptF n=1 Tax=Umboniibacter marinipuniceus TaxID=569599 RepID=A0A3M0ALT3_9GAMM|nr:LPS export ABC transporter permease LptF [Umboniibacter marinipuniceus]RMA79942.1 lipopolysaccharide export system permease protein [Umboniibacter marinipuniceus]
MILFRYVSREILATFFAVASVLLLIVVSNSLAHYLSRAAAGSLDPSVLFWILLYRIPASLEIIFPLSLFLAVLLGVGRMYMDSEVAVLFATGTSLKKLSRWILTPALVIAASVGFITFYLGPTGLQSANEVFDQQRSRSEVDRLIPGRFMNIGGGSGVVYTESVGEGQLGRVFVASAEKDEQAFVILAPSAHEEQLGENRYIVLKDGVRFDVTPGELGGRELRFGAHGILIPQADIVAKESKLKTWSTLALWDAGEAEHMAVLHYRLSLTLMVPIITLLAIGFGRSNPRSGRFAKIIPGILIFLLYFALITATQSAIEDGQVPIWLGMWWIHLSFGGLAWWLLTSDEREMKKSGGGVQNASN